MAPIKIEPFLLTQRAEASGHLPGQPGPACCEDTALN